MLLQLIMLLPPGFAAVGACVVLLLPLLLWPLLVTSKPNDGVDAVIGKTKVNMEVTMNMTTRELTDNDENDHDHNDPLLRRLPHYHHTHRDNDLKTAAAMMIDETLVPLTKTLNPETPKP